MRRMLGRASGVVLFASATSTVSNLCPPGAVAHLKTSSEGLQERLISALILKQNIRRQYV